MDRATQNRIVTCLHGIAVGVLRDLFERGRYPCVFRLTAGSSNAQDAATTDLADDPLGKEPAVE